jgi:hypothetical protein
MFSSIQASPENGKGTDESLKLCRVVIACSRPLMHTRPPPLPPLSMPSTSLHLDRHKLISALSSAGVEMEVEHLPEFTRNSLATYMEESDRAPDILVMSGSGTSYDEKLILEDGFGSADFMDLDNMHLLVPMRPKLLVAIGSFSPKFGQIVSEEGVAPAVLLLDNSEKEGALESYEVLALMLKAMLRGQGAPGMSVKTIFDRLRTSLEQKGRTTSYASLWTALPAVAPYMPLPLAQGTCR